MYTLLVLITLLMGVDYTIGVDYPTYVRIGIDYPSNDTSTWRMWPFRASAQIKKELVDARGSSSPPPMAANPNLQSRHVSSAGNAA